MPEALALVAGGAGFLGAHLCRALLARGAAVICLDNFSTGHHVNLDACRIAGRFTLVEHDITQPLPGRGACQSRDACWLGCPYGAYFSTQSSTLPAAMATGNLTLKPFSIVSEVIYDKDKKRARGVRVIDALTNATISNRTKRKEQKLQLKSRP